MQLAPGLWPRFSRGCGVVPLLALLACTRGPGTVGNGGSGTTLAGSSGAQATLTAGRATSTAPPAAKPAPPLPPLPPLPGDRLAARLTDLAGTADFVHEGKSLAAELQAFDTPYKLVSPYSGLRGESALRVIEVAVADPDVETYPSPHPAAPPPGGSEKQSDGPPAKTSAPPKFDPVWNRFRGVYESKVALLAPAPSCYRFQVALPPRGTLSFYTAAVPPQNKAPAASPAAAIEFVVSVDGKELWRRATTSLTAGRWQPAELALPAGDAAHPTARRQLALCSRQLGSGPPAGVAVWGTPELWAEGEGQKAPNLLLILIDTLRADAATAMPGLAAYAASSGVRFTQAITAATWTRPAVLALLGGDLPSAIGQNAEDMIPKERDRQRFYALDRRLLPRVLHEQGFRVSAIGNNFFLLGYPQIGLSLGFDEVADVRHPVLDSPAITRAAVQYFAQHKRRPFFLQLHYDAPHWPYSPPPEYLAKVTARDTAALCGNPPPASQSAAGANEPPSSDSPARSYLAEAAYADAELGKVLAALRHEGLAERTLVVIFGDHGEVFDLRHNHFVLALKQPTIYHHGWSAYDETLRVPLVLGMPGRLPAGVVVSEQVRLTDVAPTILEVLGLAGQRAALPGGVAATGQSLVPLIQGQHEPAERPAFVEGQNVRALRAGGYLYLRRSDPRLQRAAASATASSGQGPVQHMPEELYSLKDDPLQHHNLLLGPRDPAVERALLAMREAFGRNAPPLPEAQLPVTHLHLAPSGGRSRVLAGIISSADAQLSVAGVTGGEVSPLGPGRLEVTLHSGGRLDLNADADARLQLQLTLDGLPLGPEGLLLGPYSLPLLHSTPADLGTAGDAEGALVISGTTLARLTAAYPPVPGERGDVLLWRDQASPAASAPLWSRSTQATQGEVATMMRDWGYAQPAAATTSGPGPSAGSAAAPPPAPGKPAAARDGGTR